VLAPEPTIIGITAAFGSGSTTAAKWLRDDRAFHLVTLSSQIRESWDQQNPNVEPSRHDLQKLGDDLRDAHGPAVLVERALQTIDSLEEPIERVVFDGIRNLGEIRALRARFQDRFTLFAVLCDIDARWERIATDHYLAAQRSRADFMSDDERDFNEESPTGQQVQLCIDEADVVLDNAGYVNHTDYHQKVLKYADLVVGEDQRPPTADEVRMHVAYSGSHGTRCLKRHVGAVIVDEIGQIVAVGYNENPVPTAPCVDEPAYGGRCYRDIVRNRRFQELANDGAVCPRCKQPFGVVEGPPWRCPVCEGLGQRTNLERYFFPDRALNWCTAVHAEVWALFSAEKRARGGTLYSTTFPCMQCAEKLIQAGIVKVVYTEAYVDTAGLQRLSIAKVEVEQFEGVRSGAFDRLFAHTRPD
jgi:deoxycytidylate deaminase